jgi:beta-mannosidase
MFANQMVPADETFVENVAREAEHQIRRLRNHASLALWCGNNEMDEGWHNWGWQRSLGYTAADSATVWEAYERVFHQTLPWAVEVHDPGRFYWPSSPRHGWGRAESMTHGDSHYWGVWWGLEPFEVFLDKVPRFMSEFGFQGMPGMATIRDFTAEEDRFLGSEVLAVHQKHPTGYETVGAYMAREYAVPDDLSDFVYLSQRIQARGMRLAFEAHRRGRPRTMGTLYWQLNDTWPVVSWSSVDHAGRWKALHYAAREAFAPLLVSPVLVDDTVGVWGVWDGPEPLAGRLTVELLHVRGEAIGRWAEAVTLGGASSERVWSLSRSQVLGGADPASVVLRATFEPGAAAGVEPARALLYFVTGGELRLAEPSLALDVTRTPDGTWRVTVGSDVLAPGVHLYLEGEAAHFSDNHFDLAPGESREVVVVPEREDAREDATVERLLRARSLADVVR